jgi:hypothetical protein
MTGFQLQRKVEGVEIAVCGFFNGDRFLEPVNFNFEHKMWYLSFICSQKTRTERQTVAA